MGSKREYLVSYPIAFYGLILLIFLFHFNPLFGDDKGREIMEKVKEVRKVKSIRSRWRMTLIDGRKKETRERELITLAKEEKGLSKSITKFLKPDDVAGTGFLQIEEKEGKSVQYLYIPAIKKERRIPEGERSGRFMGSDFTYEDMEVRDISRDTHNYLRDEKINGIDTYVVESIPVDPRSSQYSKVISWIRKDNFVPVKLEFYDKHGDHFKTLTAQKVELIGEQWLVTHSVMEDYKREHKTIMELIEVEVNIPIDDSKFSIRALSKTDDF